MTTWTKAEIAGIGRWVDSFVYRLDGIFEGPCYECGLGDSYLTEKQEALLDEIKEIKREILKLGKWQTKVVCEICGRTGIMELDGDDTDSYRCYPCHEKLSNEALMRLWNKDISMQSLRKPEYLSK